MARGTARRRGRATASGFDVVQHEGGKLLLLFVSLFATFSLLGYHRLDPTWIHPQPGIVQNPFGPVGALVADALLTTLGLDAWLSVVVALGAILAIAGRPPTPAPRVVAGLSLTATVLTLLHLGYGPGDAYDFGGLVGAALADGLVTLAGTAGAWLVLIGLSVILASLTFHIRWNELASQAVVVGERVAVWTTNQALAALLAPMRSASKRMASQVSDSMGRMTSSLTRRDEDTEPWTVPSELESLDDHPEGFTPASYVETTQVNAPDAVAELQWTPTDNQEPPDAAGPRPSEV